MAQKKKMKAPRKEPPTKRTPTKVVEHVQGVGGVTAERLRKAGFGTIAKLAQAEPGRLAEKTRLNKALAKKFISAARNSYKETSAEQSPAKKMTVAEGGQTVKRKIIAETMKNEEFRRRVVCCVVDKLF